ncbi:SET domain containing protein [Venturia nashicola]|uniref:SET domain containing protein n=1 Tax=Venturia nashicola TaxID=86259 RepID=A0A4Z1P4N2_9PEZI|nr:SET domain containing protein [Venturia nashicola]
MNSPMMDLQDSLNDERHLIQVKISPGKGQGVFAKEMIDAGTTVSAEAPLLRSNMSDHDIVYQVIRLSSEDRAAYLYLHRFPQARFAARPTFPQGDRTIIDIFAANSFRVGREGAVYLLGSRFNHSCNPNVAIMTGVDGTKFFMTADKIAKDQELFISYGHHSGSKEERKSWLKDTWGFDCQCAECV